jgi:hypothetical protein
MLTRQRNCAIATLFVGAVIATFLAACSDDLSCAETATCKPQPQLHDASTDSIDGDRRGGLDTSTVDSPFGTDHQDVTPADRSGDTISADVRIDVTQQDARAGDDRTVDAPPNDSLADNADGVRNSDVTSGADTRDELPGTRGDAGDASDAGTTQIDVSVDHGVAADAPNVPDVVVVNDVSTDAMSADACPLNACGGCGPLGAEPGAPCGQCGKYACASDKLSVVCDDPGYVKYKSVAVGGFGTCGLLTTGGVRCWGMQSQDNPWLVPPSVDFLDGVQAITSGWLHSCGVTASGVVRCWGANNEGQLGDGTTVDHWTAPTLDVASGIQSVGTGTDHTCALSAMGDLRCWGTNYAGQLGDGTTMHRTTPPAAAILFDVQAVAAHESYTCALMKSGGVRCWGTFDQSGTGLLSHPPSTDLFSGVKALSAGLVHACALMDNGDVRCWGDNRDGQLGDGTTTTQPNAPTISVLGGVQAISVGRMHTCALMTSGSVRCWGGNYDGQLGDGTASNRSDAASAPEVLTGVALLATGGADHNCALLTTGRLRCWGSNNYGQIGAGDRSAHLTPTDVRDVCP